MNLLPYNNCKIVNIIWVDRGILLSIISFIIDNYTKLLDKTIIINNKIYRKFLRIIFSQLEFKKFKKETKNNFYFNIRQIIKDQDVVIDYLQNYNDMIYTDKINLVPWYDMNDPIILYEKSKSGRDHDINKYKEYIKSFSSCRRGNYNNSSWDLAMERSIFIKYNKFNYKVSVISIFNLFNKFILNNYTDTTNNNTIYIPIMDNNINSNEQRQKNTDFNEQEINNKNNLEKIKLDSNNKITALIDILSNNINNIYNYLN
jgi:hypothetical protein